MTNRSRFDTGDGSRPSSGQDLDHKPLNFGKHKGKTPEWVAENDPSYLLWLYELGPQPPRCSLALYNATQRDDNEDDPEFPDGSPMFGPGDL